MEVDENEEHAWYAWDVVHECGHKVVYRAICDAHAFSSPAIGANTSTLLARIGGEPCPWCGGQAYYSTSSEKPPQGVILRTNAANIAHLLISQV
jgi:hypothetical protein